MCHDKITGLGSVKAKDKNNCTQTLYSGKHVSHRDTHLQIGRAALLSVRESEKEVIRQQRETGSKKDGKARLNLGVLD